MLESLLTPADVADRCHISTKTVLRAIHRGRLRAFRLGEQGAYRMREADVVAWIDSSVLIAALPEPVARAAVTGPLGRPSEGRLKLTPEMGGH